MKSTTAIIATVLLVFASLISIGCAVRPEAEIEMAQTAMNDAKAQEAEQYAPDDWAKGMKAWDEAQGLLQDQRYDEAKALLVEVAGDFNTARDVAQERRQAMIQEVQNIQSAIQEQYPSLKDQINNRRVPSTLRKEIQDSTPWIDERIDIMEGAVDEQHYVQARDAGNEALSRIYELQAKIQGEGK